MLTKEQIQAFPKVELHCHLDGSIRPETLQTIAQMQDLPIEKDLAVVREKMQAPAKCRDLVEYLSCFDYVLPYLQTKEALTLAAFDVMEQAYEDGIRYIEIRFAPSLSQAKGLSVADVIQAVAQGIAQAEEKYLVIGNLLVVGMRQDDVPAIAKVFQEATAMQAEKVVGFDLAGPEDDDFVLNLRESFDYFVNETQSVALTLHAGECGCVRNVTQAVEAGARRIGHGTSLSGHADLQAMCRAHDVCIEGCPTSNVQTNAIATLADYPLREWLANRLPLSINTDNKTVSNTTLTEEFWQLVTLFHLTSTEFLRLNETALKAAFTTEQIKATILSEMQKATETW